MPPEESVVERAGFGKAECNCSFDRSGIRTYEEEVRKFPASLLNQFPMRRRFAPQPSLQGTPTNA
jgi:hypothetical protein